MKKKFKPLPKESNLPQRVVQSKSEQPRRKIESDLKEIKIAEKKPEPIKTYKKKRKYPNEKPFNKKRFIIIALIFSVVVSIVIYIFTRNILVLTIAFPSAFILLSLYSFMRIKLKESDKVKKIENAFPDFLQLMASNLRAGITTDKALLLSARKEFAPLDKEILKLGKDLVTGKKIEQALDEMAQRIRSGKIKKTIALITSGIKTGGNLATLLEETAANMKEREFVEKKASSNVLMYVIFIFFAAAIGAPALFGLSSTLVEVLTDIFSNIPELDNSKISLPFTLTKITISTTFINYFSFIFLICIDILAALVIGIVQKGEEKEGLKFVVPLLTISLSVYFAVKFFLTRYFSDFLS